MGRGPIGRRPTGRSGTVAPYDLDVVATGNYDAVPGHSTFVADSLAAGGGHVGYGIRPSARRQGLATWALGRAIGAAGALGLDRLLIVCAVGNVASARTIEQHGGVLADVRSAERGPVRRYWVKVS